MMSLQEAAKMLGGEVSRDQILCPGPGHSKRDRSLSVKFVPGNQDGFICTSFANDDFKACRDHVKAVLGIDRTRTPVRFAPVKYNDDADNVKIALRLWEQTTSLAGTLAETYLRSRGITDIEVENLRFHPDLKSDRKSFPGMVGLYRDVFTDQPCGIHRTFLTDDAHKITRKMLGRAHQAAIKLDPDTSITAGLHIGEGIETVLTGRQLGLAPAWAATSVGAIGDFPVLPGIETLTILGEMDPSGTSEREGRKCARRWLESGAHVHLVTPKHGKDLNDAIRGGEND
jgi:putative DNA primase/helicase